MLLVLDPHTLLPPFTSLTGLVLSYNTIFFVSIFLSGCLVGYSLTWSLLYRLFHSTYPIDNDDNEEHVSDPEIKPEQQPEPEEPPPPDQRPPAVWKFDSFMDEKYWQDRMVESVIQEHCIGLVIKEYINLETTLSTPQYRFQKGMNFFKKSRHEVIVKELDKNLTGQNVINILPAPSITHAMIKMSLAYLMFLKRKRSGLVKARGCADSRPQREY